MTADQYRDLISKMNDIYRRIGDKLNSWRNKEHGGSSRSIKCDSTANKEICNLGQLTFVCFFAVQIRVNKILVAELNGHQTHLVVPQNSSQLSN